MRRLLIALVLVSLLFFAGSTESARVQISGVPIAPKTIAGTISALVFANPLSVDLDAATIFTLTATGNTTLNATNVSSGQWIWVFITDDGGGPYTIQFGTNFTAIGNLVTTASATYTLNFINDGTTLREAPRSPLAVNQPITITGDIVGYDTQYDARLDGATGDGVTDDRASLNTAVTNASNKTLNVPPLTGGGIAVYRISSDLTLSGNTKIEKGAQISVDAGDTLTISGSFQAGNYQVFTGAGDVTINDGAVDFVVPDWWGAVAGGDSAVNRAAFQAALDSGADITKILIPSGVYAIATDITLDEAVEFSPGAVLDPDTGATITISAPIEAPIDQIFDTATDGDVVFTEGSTEWVLPNWWGAVAGGDSADNQLAFQAALDSGADITKILIPAGSYAIATDMTFDETTEFSPGAVLDPDAGATITIAATIETPIDQIFDTAVDGDVVFDAGTTEYVIPDWWGAVAGGDSAANRAAFQAALDSGVDTTKVLIPAGSYAIATDITLDEVVEFSPGAIIDPDGGATITIDAPIDAPINQIFDTATEGAVVFETGSVEYVLPQWLGAVGDGATDNSTAFNDTVDAAVNIKTIQIPAGVYSMLTDVDIQDILLDMDAGAIIDIGAGATLTIGSGQIDASPTQVFQGAGDVAFGEEPTVNILPQWWGAVGDGVTNDSAAFISAVASAAGRELLILGTDASYLLEANVTVPAGVTVTFQQGGLLLIDTAITFTVNGALEAGRYQIFSGAGSAVLADGAVTQVWPDWWGASAVTTMTDGDTTPPVNQGNTFKTANTAPTTITMLDSGFTGQSVIVIVNDANTTFDFTSTNLKGNGGVDWAATSGDLLQAVFDGTDWYCDIVPVASGFVGTIDISDDTNLAVTAPITLTDDTVGITIAKDIVAGDGLTGGEDDVLPGGDADTTITVGGGDGVIVNADEIEVYGLVASDGDPNDAFVLDAAGKPTAGYGLDVTGTMAATTVAGANVTTGADPGHTHTGASLTLLWNEISNPGANKTFNMGSNSTSFAFTNPTGQPTYDGAFEIQANGAFTGDLLHVHQHTGNPGATDLVHLESEDADVVPLRVEGVGAINSIFGGGVIQLDDPIVFTPSTAQVINAVGDSIDPDAGTVVLNPNADYVLTSTPTILAGTYEGQEFHVRGANAEANTVTLQDITELGGSTLRLKGATTIIAGQATTTFVWDGTNWIEDGAQTITNIKKATIVNNLNIPHGDNPTTTDDTELAFDTNDDALEVYDGVQSVLIPTRKNFQVVFADPDALQALADGWPLLNVKVADYPFGIVIENLFLSTDQASTYDAAFEEWTTPTSGSASAIETVSTSASTEADDDGIDNPTIEAGNYVFLDMDTDDLIWIMVGGTYRVTEGN